MPLPPPSGAEAPPPAAGPPAAHPSLTTGDAWARGPTGPTLTAGSLIARTFRVWWANLGKLVLMTLVVTLPIVLGGGGGAFLARGDAPAGSDPSAAFAVMGLTFLVAVPLGLMVLGGITYGVFRWLAGQRAGVGEMLARGARRMVGLFLAILLVALATFAGYLLLVVPGIFIATATSVAVPAVVVERIGPVRAFQRSFDLTRGHRWSLFAAFLGVLAINFVVSMAAGLLQVIPVVGAIASMVLSLALATMPYVLPAVAYHDLRLLKEGVDTSELVKVFE